MSDMFKAFLKEEDGLGTIEMVVLIGVLMAVALLFREKIQDFVTALTGKIFNPDPVPGAEPDR